MDDRGQHCPFLNRADERCAAHFRLGQLGGAFEHCFDRYPACPLYQEMLQERQARRRAAAARATGGAVPLGHDAPGRVAWWPAGDAPGTMAAAAAAAADPAARDPGSRHVPPTAAALAPTAVVAPETFVPLTIAHRNA